MELILSKFDIFSTIYLIACISEIQVDITMNDVDITPKKCILYNCVIIFISHSYATKFTNTII
jgi:hypothetical protein